MLSSEYMFEKRKRINKITRLDCHEGFVSKRKLDEISNDIRAKLSGIKDFPGCEVANKEAGKILAALTKVEAYNVTELQANYLPELEPDPLKRLNEMLFFTMLKRLNYEILYLEAVAQYVQAQEEKKQRLERLEHLHRDRELQLIDENNYQLQVLTTLKLHEQEIALQILQNEQYIAQLEKYQDHLSRMIEGYEEVIRDQRKYYTNKVLSYVDDIEVNGKKIFKDMPVEQKTRFIQTVMSLNELKAREIARIEYEYQKAIANLNGSTYKSDKPFLKGFGATQNENRKAELTKARDEAINKVETKFRGKVKETAAIQGIKEIKTDGDVNSFLNDSKFKVDRTAQEKTTTVVVTEKYKSQDEQKVTTQRIVQAKDHNEELKKDMKEISHTVDTVKRNTKVSEKDLDKSMVNFSELGVLKQAKEIGSQEHQEVSQKIDITVKEKEKEEKKVDEKTDQVVEMRDLSEKKVDDFKTTHTEIFDNSKKISEGLSESRTNSNVERIEMSLTNRKANEDISLDILDAADDMPDISEFTLDDDLSKLIPQPLEKQGISTAKK